MMVPGIAETRGPARPSVPYRAPMMLAEGSADEEREC